MITLSIAHAAVLAEMHRLCFDEPWDGKAMADLLAMPGAYGFLAQMEDRPQGFILCRVGGGEAEILTIAVLPDSRREGLGRSLVNAALHEARRGGAAAMFLEVASDNMAAQQLYKKMGFYRVGLRKSYYHNNGDAHILRCDI